MPIDPSILGTIGQGVVKLDTPDEVALRQARLLQARETVQQTIESARQRAQARQDDADLQSVIQTNLGPDGLPDFSKAIPAAYAKNPRVGAKLLSAFTAARKSTAETDELEDKHKTAMIDLAGQAFDGANKQNWPTRYGFLAQTNQPVARMFSPQWDETTQDKIDAFKAASLKRKDAEDLNAKVREDYLAGKDDQALARQINALGPDLTPDRAVEIARTGRDKYGIDAQTASTVAELSSQKNPDGTPNLAPLKAWARKAELGQEKVETIGDTQARNAQLKTNEDASHELERQRLVLETKRAASTDANERQRIGIELSNLKLRQQEFQQRTAEAAGVELKPGTPNYRQAQDLADGTLTFQDFQRLHSRAQADAPLRAAIYDTARQLNPNFNPASFEIGFKFASSPKVKQQVASIKNVESGVDDLLKFSDAATRSGSPTLNQYAVKPIQTALGNKSYSNFKTAVTAFADELSGALGYGSATDMSREMGFNMTDMNQSPANFKSNVESVVIPFLARKKATILGQMGPYSGTADSGGTGGKSVTAAQIQAVAKKNGTTVQQETDRAKAEGYVVK